MKQTKIHAARAEKQLFSIFISCVLFLCFSMFSASFAARGSNVPLMFITVFSNQDVNVDLPTKIRAWEFLQSICVGTLDLPNASLDTNKTAASADGNVYAYIEGSEFLAAVRRFVTIANKTDGVDVCCDRLLVQSACCVDGGKFCK